MNPLYQQLTGGHQPVISNMQPINMLQKIGYVRQAMANPAILVKQQFPDIPDQMMNNPNQILNYLQQTRGISDQQIQNLIGMLGGMKL